MNVGTQGNAWTAAATTGGAANSSAVDVRGCAYVQVFGAVSGAVTLTVQFSQDGTNFYDSTVTIAPSGAADVYAGFACAANYVRVKASANITATVTIAGR